MLTFDFPAIKEWKIHANQRTNSWFLPKASKVELEFKDFEIDLNCDLKVNELGYVNPIVYGVDL